MKYQFLDLNKNFQSSNINFEIHYVNNIHIYNFSTYIKIHPNVIVKYLEEATNLVTIATNGILKFGLVVTNIPKSNRKQVEVACSHKWSGYILVDFY